MFPGFVLGDPRFHQFFHQGGGQRLVQREADGPFGREEGLELVQWFLNAAKASSEPLYLKVGMQ